MLGFDLTNGHSTLTSSNQNFRGLINKFTASRFRKTPQKYNKKTESARNGLRYERERKRTKEKRKSAFQTTKKNERLLAACQLESPQSERQAEVLIEHVVQFLGVEVLRIQVTQRFIGPDDGRQLRRTAACAA